MLFTGDKLPTFEPLLHRETNYFPPAELPGICGVESGGDRECEMPKGKSGTVLVMVWFVHLRGGMIREISEKCLMTGSKLDDGISHYLSSGYVEPWN